MAYNYNDNPGVPPPPASGSRPTRGRGNWSPGAFSPAIFIVAAVVILLLAGVAYLSQRGGTGATPTMAGAAQATGKAVEQQPGQATGRVYVVGNTGGQGVYLRRTPRLEDRDTAYVDGTRLIQIDADVSAEGLTWRHVRAPDGRIGWVPAQYTTESR